MKIQLITIGNELLNGKIRDKNAFWLARFCYEHNIELSKNHIIPDCPQAFAEAMRQAWSAGDLIVTSGGLGPTKDDLTKELAGSFFKKELKENKSALEIAIKNYSKSKREYDPALEYSKIPEDFEAIYNAAGYAPGLSYQSEQKMLAVLPGVPSEFSRMFREEIYPKANSYLKSEEENFQKHIIVKTRGVPEAKIFNNLCPGLWEKLEAYGQVSSLPHVQGVDIGVFAQAKSQEELLLKEEKVIELIQATELNEHIWHIGNESLEEVIIQRAKEKKITIGFAESCTGGLLASRITDISGSSSVFLGSVIAYHNDVKMGVLKVKEDTLKNHGAVSSETAFEMATGAKAALGADIVVTTTGIAGPGGATPGKPVGTIGIGFCHKDDSSGELFHFPEQERVDMKFLFSQAALFKMLELIDSLN